MNPVVDWRKLPRQQRGRNRQGDLGPASKRWKAKTCRYCGLKPHLDTDGIEGNVYEFVWLRNGGRVRHTCPGAR